MKKIKSEKPSGRKRLKKLLLTLAIVVGIFITAISLSYKKTRQAELKKNQVRDEMEKMYSEGDYKKLTDYYYKRKSDLTDSKYAKYKSVSELYDEYEFVMDFMDEAYGKLTDDVEGNDDIRWELEQAFRIILLCDVCKENGYPHEEEKGVTDIRGLMTGYLTEKLLITSDEIETIADQNLKAEGLEDTKKVNEVIDELAVESMSRVVGQ